MSQNNQVIIKEHKGLWLVFNNVMAESWYNPSKPEAENELSVKEANAAFKTKEEAMNHAFLLDDEIDDYGYPNSEYGVHFNLAKDGASVTIID